MGKIGELFIGKRFAFVRKLMPIPFDGFIKCERGWLII